MLLLFLHYLLNNKKRKYKIIKILFINLFILFNFICAAPIKLEEEEENQNNMDKENKQFMNRIRIKALNNIQRSLESLNELTATSLLLKTALESNELINEDDEINEKNTKLFFNEENTKIKNKNFGLKRIKADLRRIPLTTTTSSNELFNNKNEWENEEEIFNEIATSSSSSTTAPTRRHRSAVNVVAVQREQQHLKNNGLHYNSQHHRRRKKGCPSVHGKDQLLCPSRNTYRYDVCITREQLCDRIRDCPGGEDEDSRHCFFFRPLESSLKTISHAVLLLVDTVMREQQENQRLEKRNEL